jgi:hypothetical protein
MADNKTTYETTIDVNVDGADEIQDLGDKAEQADGKFTPLRRQIRETTVALQKLAAEGKSGGKEFQELSKKLDTLKDSQARVAFQSGQIEDKLAALPGPIGQVGRGFQLAKESVETFGKTLAISLGVVTLIIGAILAFKESLSRTEEGQKKLNKISEAFEKIMNAVFAVLEPIANAVADFTISLLSNEKVMKGLSVTMGILSGIVTGLFGTIKALGGFIINNLVNYFTTLINIASNTGKVLKGVFTFDLDLIKEGVAGVGDTVKKGFTTFVDNVKETAKGIGTAVKDGYDSATKSVDEGLKRMTKKEKEAKAARDKVAKEARDKAAEEARKQREKELADFIKGQEDLLAELKKYKKAGSDVLKSERKKELDDARLQYVELLNQASKFGADTVGIDEAYRAQRDAINKKFDDADAEKKAENDKKSLDDRILGIENELSTIGLDYGKRRELIKQKETELLTDTTLTDNQRKAIKLDTSKQLLDIDRAEIDARVELQSMYADAIGQFGAVLQQIAGKNKSLAIAGVIIEQAAGIAKIIISTKAANARALVELGPIAGASFGVINTISAGLSIAASVAAGAKAIQQINSVSTNGTSKAGSAQSVSATISSPTISNTTVPQIQTGAGVNPTAQIGETVASASNMERKPIKTYVVAQDVSSKQAFDRRVNSAATF